MKDPLINWLLIALVSIVTWVLGYAGHVEYTLPAQIIQPPRWLLAFAGRPTAAYLNVHALAWQILGVSMLLVHTVLVFTVDSHTEKMMDFFVIVAGISLLLLPVIFILKRVYKINYE